jgi:hypothetical protein
MGMTFEHVTFSSQKIKNKIVWVFRDSHISPGQDHIFI